VPKHASEMFQCGDRVRIKAHAADPSLIGMCGIVHAINAYNHIDVMVVHDHLHPSLHAGCSGGFDIPHRCWWYRWADDLELIHGFRFAEDIDTEGIL